MLWFVSKKVGHPVADMKLAKGEGLSADGRMPCHERARLITEVGGGGILVSDWRKAGWQVERLA